MAKLYFKYGAMGSSKTAQALITKYNYEENDLQVWLIKPSADTRDGAAILRSRIGLEAQVEVIPPEVDIYARFLGGISANAGVFSDLYDMIRFCKMLSLDGTLPGERAYLAPATLEAARRNRTPASRGEFRGLGFNLAGSPRNFLGDLMSPLAYGHTGFTGTSIALDPATGLWVVLLTNRVCPTRSNTQLVRMRSLVHNAAAAEASRMIANK